MIRHNRWSHRNKYIPSPSIPTNERPIVMAMDFVADKIDVAPIGNGVAFDIGAHMGTYTRYLAKKFHTVYAFEPYLENYKKLTSQGVGLPANIIFKNYAISNKTGTCKLWTQKLPLDSGATISKKTLSHPLWDLDKDRYQEAQCITIDDFCETHNVVPSFIKMDIEGGEDFAWEGATKTLKENNINICLECHANVDMGKIIKLFTDCGYSAQYEKLTNLKDESGWLSRQVYLTKRR